MIEQTRTALKQLQDMDSEIAAKREQIAALGEAVLDVEAPVEALESEVATTRTRLQEMRLEERRVELLVRDRESRIEKLDERLQGVRNVREESAVRSEIDMVRQVLASTEQEALSLVDQIRRLETRLDEQEAALTEAREQVEPRRVELQAERTYRYPLPVGHFVQRSRDAMFGEFGLQEGQGEFASVDRDLRTRTQEVRDGADVVFVAVGQDDARDLVQPILDRREVGQDQVNPRLGFLGEQDAAIDDEQRSIHLEHRHVAADLTEAADRQDAHGARRERRSCGYVLVVH